MDSVWELNTSQHSGLEIPRDADLGPEQFHDKLLNTIQLHSKPTLCSLQVATPSYNNLSSDSAALLISS